MAINTATIQHRRGSLDDFNPEKLMPGELAVITDERSVYMGFPGGETEKIVLEKDFTSESIKEKLGYEPADKEKVDNEVEKLNEKIVQETGKLSNEIADKLSDLSNKVNIIVNTKSGETIIATDSSDAKFRGMNVYGKSKQNGIPTPDFPQTVVNCENTEVSVYGKNLLSPIYIEALINLTLNSGIYTQVTPDDGYAQVKTVCCDSSGKILNSTNIGIAVLGVNSITFDKTENTDRIVFGINGRTKDTVCSIDASSIPNGTYTISALFTNITQGSISWRNMQLERGSVSTEYEPYKEKQSLTIHNTLCGIPVSSGGNYTDDNGQQWVCDEIDLERGVYVQRVGSVEFDGNENWTYNTDYKYFLIYFSGLEKKPVNNSPTASTHFLYGDDNNMCFAGTSGIAFYTDAYTTIEEWKAWLLEQHTNNTPVTVYYILATPVETPLTEEQIAAYKALHSNYPNTTVLNNNGAGMMVKYGADTKLYIDKKFAELAAQLV